MRRATKEQIEKNKKSQKLRIKLKKAARRSRKSIKNEGKVTSSKGKRQNAHLTKSRGSKRIRRW